MRQRWARRRRRRSLLDRLGWYSLSTAQVLGGSVMRFARVNGCTVNVLDPAISLTSHLDDAGAMVVGQDELLVMVATHAHGPLTSQEGAALQGVTGAAR